MPQVVEVEIHYPSARQRGVPVRIEYLVRPTGIQPGGKHELASPTIRDIEFSNGLERLADEWQPSRVTVLGLLDDGPRRRFIDGKVDPSQPYQLAPTSPGRDGEEDESMKRGPRGLGTGRQQRVSFIITEEADSAPSLFLLAHVLHGILVDETPLHHSGGEDMREGCEVAIHCSARTLVSGWQYLSPVLGLTHAAATKGLQCQSVASFSDAIRRDRSEAEISKSGHPPGDVTLRVHPP